MVEDDDLEDFEPFFDFDDEDFFRGAFIRTGISGFSTSKELSRELQNDFLIVQNRRGHSGRPARPDFFQPECPPLVQKLKNYFV